MGSFNIIKSHCQRQDQEDPRRLNRTRKVLPSKEQASFYDHHQQQHHHLVYHCSASSLSLHHEPFNVLLGFFHPNIKNGCYISKITKKDNNKSKTTKTTSSSSIPRITIRVTNIKMIHFPFPRGVYALNYNLMDFNFIPHFQEITFFSSYESP